MKNFLIITALVLALAVPAFAQWGTTFQAGDTILHRNDIDYGEFWFAQSPNQVTSSALELAGYNAVRADYDITGTQINVNMMCSNDSIWVSGDSVEVTSDTHAEYDLIGCKDYNWFVESVDGASASIDIYLTPYNK